MKLSILVDDLRNSGSVVVADAATISHAELNRMVTLGSGPVQAILSQERAGLFQLEPMARLRSRSEEGLNITTNSTRLEYTAVPLVSVEAREGVHSGISIADRLQTIRCLTDPTPHPRLLVSPGHVFPLRSHASGFMGCADLPHGASYLIQREAGNKQAVAVFCDLCSDLPGHRGQVMDCAEAYALAEREQIPAFSLRALLTELLEASPLVRPTARTRIPLENQKTVGLYLFADEVITQREHLAVVYLPERIFAAPACTRASNELPELPGVPFSGTDFSNTEFSTTEEVLVRVHRKNPTQDLFGIGNSPSGLPGRFQRGLERIIDAPSGVLLYLDTEGDTHGGPAAHSPGHPLRDYAVGAQILRSLGVQRARIVSDSSRITPNSSIFGIQITAQEPLEQVTKSEIQGSSL